MKTIGTALIVGSIIGILYSLTMDVSVVTKYGDRVNNIGLMQTQQNFLLLSLGGFIGGIILWVLGKESPSKINEAKDITAPDLLQEVTNRGEYSCPNCGNSVEKEAITCPKCSASFEGENAWKPIKSSVKT